MADEPKPLQNLGWLNAPSPELCAAMDACDAKGHTREEMWHGPTTTVMCRECGFWYQVDSSD